MSPCIPGLGAVVCVVICMAIVMKFEIYVAAVTLPLPALKFVTFNNHSVSGLSSLGPPWAPKSTKLYSAR